MLFTGLCLMYLLVNKVCKVSHKRDLLYLTENTDPELPETSNEVQILLLQTSQYELA